MRTADHAKNRPPLESAFLGCYGLGISSHQKL
jgi:hypothetical protein